MQPVDNRDTIKSALQIDAVVEVRGPDSGHLYGRLDPVRGLLEVRKGKQVEVIDLRRLLTPRAEP
jgi:hypothetical protein